MRYSSTQNWRPSAPTDFGTPPLILPQRTTLGWRGHVGVRSLKPAAGTIYYVDIVNGDNANAGTDPALPVQWIWVAMDKADTALGTLKIAPGHYPYTAGWRDPTAVGALSVTASYSAERWAIRPGPVTITSAPFSFAWTQEGGGNTSCYTGDANTASGGSAAITQVVDLSVRNPDGAPYTYAFVGSIAACQANPGSWYTATHGTTTEITVHTLNGGEPGAHIIPLQLHTAASDLSRRTLYIDGLDFIGGGSGFIKDNNSGTPGGRLYARNCRAFSSYINGFQSNGQDHSIMERCKAISNRGDGMVYNQSNGLGTDNAIEIECEWIDSGGVSTAGIINETINGSTSHAGTRITRIASMAARSQGPNFADTNGALSWNIGCVAGGTSTHITTAQDSGFQATNAGTKMWLLECASSSNTHDLFLNSGSEVYVDRCNFGVITNSSGTLASYRNR